MLHLLGFCLGGFEGLCMCRAECRCPRLHVAVPHSLVDPDECPPSCCALSTPIGHLFEDNAELLLQQAAVRGSAVVSVPASARATDQGGLRAPMTAPHQPGATAGQSATIALIRHGHRARTNNKAQAAAYEVKSDSSSTSMSSASFLRRAKYECSVVHSLWVRGRVPMRRGAAPWACGGRNDTRVEADWSNR